MSFCCDTCGSTFTLKCNLQRHVRNSICDKRDIKLDPVKLDANRVKCTACEKEVLRTTYKRHMKTCKGIPKNMCCFCSKTFVRLSQHKRVCKQRFMETEDPIPPTQPQTIGCINYGDNNTIDQSVSNNTQYITNINVHGKENFESLVTLLRERFASEMVQVLENNDGDVIFKLAYFNRDFPENQTIQKPNKKDLGLLVHEGGAQWSLRPANDTLRKDMDRIKDNVISPYVQRQGIIGYPLKETSKMYLAELAHQETIRDEKNNTQQILGGYTVPDPFRIDVVFVRRKLKDILAVLISEFPTFNERIPLWKKELRKRTETTINDFEEKWNVTWESVRD